jgi:hypothetical protein
MANSRLVFASSDLRDSNLYPDGNSYTLHMTLPVKNISKIDLVSAHFPNSMYNITKSSNVISINGTSNIFMYAGRYDQVSLALTLTSAGFTTTYVKAEGHFLISNVSSYNFVVTNSELANLMGFVTNKTYTLVPADPKKDPLYPTSNIVRSDFIANLTMNDYMFLDIEELRTPNNLSTGPLYKNTINGTNVNTMFAPIMIKNSHLSAVTNFMETKDILLTAHYPEPIASIDRLTIRWRDKNGDILNFHGLNSNSFILRFHVNDGNERMKEFQLPPPVPMVDFPHHYIVWVALVVGIILLIVTKGPRTT